MKESKTAYLPVSTKKIPIKSDMQVRFFPYQYTLDEKGSKNLRQEKRLGILFVPNKRCTNKCIFCEPNIPAMEKAINKKLSLSKEPSIKKIIKDTKELYSKNKDINEIVIGAGIGEPFIYFDKLLMLIRELKIEFPVKIRLNTNGQASQIIKKYSSQEACKELEKSGLDFIMISLNAINKEDYDSLCKPKLKKAFESTIEFIKICNKSKVKTFVSFLDYPELRGYPKLNREKIKKFIIKLGLKEDQIIYRPIITKEENVKH